MRGRDIDAAEWEDQQIYTNLGGSTILQKLDEEIKLAEVISL